MHRKLSPFVVFFLAVCATLVCAAVSVRIEEWSIPPADRFPHDPAVAPDGALWFTGMGSNTLGRLDLIHDAGEVGIDRDRCAGLPDLDAGRAVRAGELDSGPVCAGRCGVHAPRRDLRSETH